MPVLDVLAALSLGGDPAAAGARDGPFSGDRAINASDTLARLR
jgi:hypothetical protein